MIGNRVLYKKNELIECWVDDHTNEYIINMGRNVVEVIPTFDSAGHLEPTIEVSVQDIIGTGIQLNSSNIKIDSIDNFCFPGK